MSDIKLSPKQVRYLLQKTQLDNVQQAYNYFVLLMEKEGINPSRFLHYLNRMMEKDGIK